MAHMAIRSTIRPLRAAGVFAISLISAGAIFASASAAPAPVTNQDTAMAGTLSPSSATTFAPAGKIAPANQRPASKPLWNNLTVAQQQALAPLMAEWDKLDPTRKVKWLAIGNKFASMNPDEQQRIQERMREWVRLTPEQRRIARESYARTKKLNPDQKSTRWRQYQQLPEEQKKKLAAAASTKKNVASLPPASQSKAKTVPPIKSTPKPVLEKSVTSHGAAQSALQSSSQPATK